VKFGFFAIVLGLLWACDRPAPPPPPSPPTPVPHADGSAPAIPAPTAAASSPSGDASATPASDEGFEPVVGEWRPEEVGGTKGYAVDGTKWRDGTPSANLADQARRLYGDRYAEFLDGVKTFAFFPLAVAKADPPKTGEVRISVRFHPLAGKIDQAAGIAFGIADDGSYWGVRANALEDNVLFFRVVKGKRTVLETVRNVPTPTRTWHTLVVELRGAKLSAFVDGTKRIERTLDAPPKGRVGLWSKADSHVVFADFNMSTP
jgi:hypothetical protein